jgi:protein TonB
LLDKAPPSPENAQQPGGEAVEILQSASDNHERVAMAAEEPEDANEARANEVILTDPATTSNEALEAGNVIAPVAKRAFRPELVAVAAVTIVAVVGVPMGARWLRDRMTTQNVSPSPTTQAPKAVVKEQAAHRATVPAAPPKSELTAIQPQPAAAPPAAVVTRQPAAPPARLARVPSAPRKVDPQTMPAPQVPPAAELSPMTVATLGTQAAVPPPAQEPARFASPEPPVGRLFDPSEVDEAPRIATRIEPQLPGSVGHAGNEVVIVRILVSQTGHPFRVNLLRRSRLGSPADEAVLAAVRQWTFSPARRHGEAVSCWFNFAVTLAN